LNNYLPLKISLKKIAPAIATFKLSAPLPSLKFGIDIL